MAKTVCYFGTYDTKFNKRNNIIIGGLRENNITVVECHEALWKKHNDKTSLSLNIFTALKLAFRYILLAFRLFQKFTQIKNCDVVIIGYFGYIDIFLIRIFTLFRKNKKIFLDAYISIYDSLVHDRKTVKEKSLKARLIYFFEKTACGLAEKILLDTDHHINHFSKLYGINKNKFIKVLVGTLPTRLKPFPAKKTKTVTVFNYATYIPLHGHEMILHAAKMLEHYPFIKFILVGNGQEYNRIYALSKKMKISNIEFIRKFVASRELARYLSGADICLGIFGKTRKTYQVIPNKIYDYMLYKKPVITLDTPAIKELFRDGYDIVLVNKKAELAKSILDLAKNKSKRRMIAEHAHMTYKTYAESKKIVLPILQQIK